MNKSTLTTVNNLQIGDRFYFASDKNKVVWEMVKRERKVTHYQTYRYWCILGSLADSNMNEVYKRNNMKPLQADTRVVYLRSKEVEGC